MKTIIQILCLLLLQTSCATYKAPTKNQDLDFIYQTIIDNHPGIYNDQDPGFKNHLDKEYKKAKKLLARNSEPEKEHQVIKNFTQSFNDAYLFVRYFDDKKINTNKLENSERFEVRNIHEQLAWVTLPTFDLDTNQQKQFDRMLKAIPRFDSKKHIVFDLRGNQGGNSAYGSRIVNKLFGEKYADLRRYETRGDLFVDWRASEGNLVHLNNLYKKYKAQWIKDIADGMKLAMKEGRVYYREGAAKKKGGLYPHNLFKTKIVVIIDSGNFSAALDFIDELKMMSSEVILVGKQTKSDRLYMEARVAALPSGRGIFSFPIKVYRGRQRGDNVPYKPDFECETIDAKTLEQFIHICK